MNEGDIHIQQEDPCPSAEERQAGGLSLLQSLIGVDALQSAKDLLLSGVSFPSAVRQAAVSALERAGVGNDKMPQLEAEIVSAVTKEMLKPLFMKIFSPLEMTKNEVVEEIRAIGFEEEGVQTLAEVLWSKRKRLRELAAAKIKEKVLGRLKDRQTAAQQEMLGKILDETLKRGVRSVTEEDIVEAWKRVKASDKP